MKRVSVFLLLTCSFLLFLTNNAGADIWANGVSQGSGWFDAEKDSVNTEDNLLCWAASAANILAWSGWDAGFGNEDTIFDWLEAEDEEDQGGWQSWAWDFWFTGTKTGGHYDDSSHTGFYSTAEYNAALAQEWDNADLDVALDIASNWLQNDYGVGLAVRDFCYHAVTLWGIDTDESTGDYLGVWITDSDSSKGGPDPRPDTLNYYSVSYGADNLWHLNGMCGDAAIIEMDALKMYAEPVPEPAALLLMTAGLLGLGIFKRKRSNKI